MDQSAFALAASRKVEESSASAKKKKFKEQRAKRVSFGFEFQRTFDKEDPSKTHEESVHSIAQNSPSSQNSETQGQNRVMEYLRGKRQDIASETNTPAEGEETTPKNKRSLLYLLQMETSPKNASSEKVLPEQQLGEKEETGNPTKSMIETIVEPEGPADVAEISKDFTDVFEAKPTAPVSADIAEVTMDMTANYSELLEQDFNVENRNSNPSSSCIVADTSEYTMEFTKDYSSAREAADTTEYTMDFTGDFSALATPKQRLSQVSNYQPK